MAFMVDSVKKKRVRGPTQQLSQLVGGGPPLYGMKTLALLNCDTSYLLDIEEGELISQEFDMQEDKCVSTLRDEEAKKLLESHLINRGFTLPYQKYLGSD